MAVNEELTKHGIALKLMIIVAQKQLSKGVFEVAQRHKLTIVHERGIPSEIGHRFDLIRRLQNKVIDAECGGSVIRGVPNETQFGHFAIGPFLGHCEEIDEIERARWRFDENGFLEFGNEFVENEGGIAKGLKPMSWALREIVRWGIGIEAKSSAVFNIVAERIDLMSCDTRKCSDIYSKLCRVESASSSRREATKMLDGIELGEKVIARIGGIDVAQRVSNL